MEVYDEQSNYHSVKFLLETIKRAPFTIRAIKTDNHSTFTNRYTGYQKSIDPFNPKLHIFDLVCMKYNILHYLIDPGKPQQNGAVERSHRSDQESFYDMIKYNSFEELRYKIRLWNIYYNDLEHCGLNGLTPNEYLKLSA